MRPPLVFAVSFSTEAAVCNLSDVTVEGVDASVRDLVAGNDTVGGGYENWDVNLKAAGGASDWMDFQKSDGDETIDLGLMVNGSGSSGAWSYDPVYQGRG